MKTKIIKFATSSFIGFLIDYAIFCSLSYIFPDSHAYILIANITARTISAVCNYILNCRFVFKEKQTIQSAISYFLLAVFILCMNNALLLIYNSIPGLSLYLAKIFTELTLFIMSYIIQKKIVFHNKKNSRSSREF